MKIEKGGWWNVLEWKSGVTSGVNNGT